MFSSIGNKKGYEFVEASIVMPVIVIVTLMVIRLFTFYLEILTTGVNMHEEAMNAVAEKNAPSFRTFKSHDTVQMAPGVLSFAVDKELETKAYIINESKIVRMGKLIDE